jgi:hypothetical protein
MQSSLLYERSFLRSNGSLALLRVGSGFGCMSCVIARFLLKSLRLPLDHGTKRKRWCCKRRPSRSGGFLASERILGPRVVGSKVRLSRHSVTSHSSSLRSLDPKLAGDVGVVDPPRPPGIARFWASGAHKSVLLSYIFLIPRKSAITMTCWSHRQENL